MFPTRCTLALLVGFGAAASTHGQPDLTRDEAGIPVAQAFGVRDYEEHNQNWAAVQDDAGILYVGNKDVVLTYDGQAWNSIRTGGSFIRSLARDDANRIWVGGVDEFGYLEADGLGGRRYVSLAEHLPQGLAEPLNFFHLHVTSHGVYLVSDERVLRWRDGKVSTVVEGQIRGWQEGDELWVHGAGSPLYAFDGADWREVLPAAALGKRWVCSSLLQPDGSRLLFTVRDGAFVLREGELAPWPNEGNDLMRELITVDTLRLHDDAIAVRLRLRGMLILSPTGRLLNFFDAANDTLPVSVVLGLFEDKTHGLWITLNSGLTRISRELALTRFDRRRGLGTNTVKAIRRHAGRLYVGTGDKLLVLRHQTTDTPVPTPAGFEPVAGGDASVWALASVGDELLIGGRDGLRTLGPGSDSAEHVVDSEFISALLPLPEAPEVVWSGTQQGLDLLHREKGRWVLARSFAEIPGLIRALSADADGAAWAAVDGRGYYRLSRPAGSAATDATAWQVEHFPGGHGLPVERVEGLPSLSHRAGRAVFLVEGTMFEFDPARRTFIPLREAAPRFANGHRHVTLAPGLNGTMWARTTNQQAEAGPWQGRVFWHCLPDGSVRALPFALADRVGENPMFFEEDGPGGHVLWIGGSEGLVRAVLPSAFLQPQSFATLLRRVQLRSGEHLPLSPATPTELASHQHGLTFHFATSRIDDPGMRFQTRWSGNGEEWSPLSRVPELTIERLAAGAHVLEVRARDTNGRLGVPARYAFTIRPPWWQTRWALALFGCALVGCVGLLQRWRLRTVERRNAELSALVDHRTSELRENQAQLIEARDAANAANQAKSDFLAAMSHELRTPLNAILGFAQLLHRDDGLSPRSRQQLDIINRNGRHLLGMINEVLDLAKIEAGKLTLHPSPCSLGQLAHELAEMFEPRAQEKGLIFRLELDLQTPRVLADAAKLRQVLLNLLANAIKFTHAGEVVLGLYQTADRFHFSVRDTGVGIAPHALRSVFAPFQQMQVAPTPTDSGDSAGTGLGLPISQNLVQLMGGHIELESEVGRGSRFHFELILSAAPATNSASPLPTRIIGYHGRRRHLLVVDDVATNLILLQEMLEPLGFEISTADSGEAALTAQQRRPAELVLLDLRLPGISGAELTIRLRAETPHRLPIIAVSASVIDLNTGRTADFGCDAFVIKPVQEDQLLDAIRTHLDLEWITRSTLSAPYPAPTPPPAGLTSAEQVAALPLPPRDLLEDWLKLARRSDQRQLRRALEADTATGSDAPFRQELDRRLQRFRTGEVARILTLALARASTTLASDS